jgi:LPS-assembly protein
MKNKFKSLIFFLCFFLFNLGTYSSEIEFVAKEIQIIDNQNLTIAIDAQAIVPENKLSLKGNKIEHYKDKSLLKITKGDFTKDDNLFIKADNTEYLINDSFLDLKNNVEVKDLKNNLNIKSNQIYYDLIKEKIKSDKDSVIVDSSGNIYNIEEFIFNRKENLIILTNTKVTDKQNNIYFFEKAYLNTLKKELIAKDISLDFKRSASSLNEPRLKGRAIKMDKNKSIIKKGNFTLCKKRDGCPPWELSAEEIIHDKNKKTINYKNAKLKLYDKNVFYFPKFFHPDPTVKRQSGFLFPRFQDNSNTGFSFNLPYFLVLDDNKDMTISPRIFKENELLLQSEFRQKNKNSNHIADFGQFISEKKDDKGHFFYNFSKIIDSNNFEEVELNFVLQQVTNNTYLKTFQINSPLITNENNLTNYLKLDFYNNNIDINTNLEVNEDLSKLNSDRYEYIPSFSLTKKFGEGEILNDKYSWYSNGFIKNYDTNITETDLLNKFSYNSGSNFLNNGIIVENNFLLKNLITDAKNSENYKSNLSSKIVPIFERNYSLPMQKNSENYNNFLTPKLSFRLSSNQTKDSRKMDRKIDYDNIFDIERLGLRENNEGSISATYGYEYIKSDKENSNEKIRFGLANNLRIRENDDLPRSSNLGKKMSDIVGALNYNPIENLQFNYDFSLKNNLSQKNYELIGFDFFIKNLSTKFEYSNDNNGLTKNSYMYNQTSYEFNKSNSIIYETRRNKELEFTEFYNLIYQYKNDCLTAGIEYSKEYYSDNDFKPTENLFFKISILPFGGVNTPNLKK